jgi:hypothetical protein
VDESALDRDKYIEYEPCVSCEPDMMKLADTDVDSEVKVIEEGIIEINVSGEEYTDEERAVRTGVTVRGTSGR